MKNLFLVVVYDDVEPTIHGPYATGEEQDRAAKELMNEPVYIEAFEGGIYPLTITSRGKATVEIDSYPGGYFDDDEEGE